VIAGPEGGSPAASLARRPSSAVAARWLLPIALLAAEYLFLSLLVDLPLAGVVMPAVRAIRVALPVVVGTTAAGWLMARTGGAAALGGPPASPPPPWRPLPALVAQPLAYLLTAVLAVHLFGAGAPQPGAAGFLAFLLCALATAALAAATAAPPAWLGRELLRRWRAPLLALALGIAAWRAAAGAEEQWGALSGLTLRASAALLSLSGPVAVDPTRATIGLRGFEVDVAPACSGADGLGLVLTFQLLWLAFSRHRLRMGRALLLLPLGLAAALAANVARIAGLVLLGAEGHESLALGGFHSKAGWALFLAIALGSAAVAGRLRWLHAPEALAPGGSAGGGRPDVASLLPLVLTLGAALATSVWTAGALDRLYLLRIGVALGALVWVRGALPPLTPSRSPLPAALGLGVGLAWIAAWPGSPGPLEADLAALGGLERAAWIGVRALGSTLVIPVVEELAFRGFLFEWLAAPAGAGDTPAGRVPWLALVVSSLAFGTMHRSFALGALAGLAFGALRAWRGRLGDAVVAHAAANAVIAAVAVLGGRWQLFG